MRFLDRHAGWLGVVLALLCLIIWTAMLTGCGQEARSQGDEDKPVGVAATFADIGVTLAWSGAIASAAGLAGLALTLVSFIAPAVAPFAAIFRLAAVFGPAIAGTGGAFIWLSDNLWLMAAACLACAVGVLWWYWPTVRRHVVARLAARQADGQGLTP